MSDLVQRLRAGADDVNDEAADRIEALEARYEAWKSVADGHLMRVKELEAALRKLLELEEVWFPGNRTAVRAKLVKDIARGALEAK